MNLSIPDTRTKVERLRMAVADEDMAYQFRFRSEMDRRAKERVKQVENMVLRGASQRNPVGLIDDNGDFRI